MATTIEDIQYETHLQEEWERERREALKVLEKIANSENIAELQKNLDKLKDIYSSEISIDEDNVTRLLSELDFSMPKIKEYFDKRDIESKRTGKIYFYIGILLSVLGITLGLL